MYPLQIFNDNLKFRGSYMLLLIIYIICRMNSKPLILPPNKKKKKILQFLVVVILSLVASTSNVEGIGEEIIHPHFLLKYAK